MVTTGLETVKAQVFRGNYVLSISGREPTCLVLASKKAEVCLEPVWAKLRSELDDSQTTVCLHVHQQKQQLTVSSLSVDPGTCK